MYRIALETAKGLSHLHHDRTPLIIHHGVKSSDILLDSSYEAHVADLRLGKFHQDASASKCMSSNAGSYGYIALEYARTLRVDEKSDGYSFGAVLLELIMGRYGGSDIFTGGATRGHLLTMSWSIFCELEEASSGEAEEIAQEEAEEDDIRNPESATRLRARKQA